MDVSQLLDSLNEKQRDVVAAPLQNMLVLAGAKHVYLFSVLLG